MSAVEIIIKNLYLGLIDYVPNKRKKEYTDEYTIRKAYNTKFALKFFPKYIDFEKWSKKPKKPYDINLINYWLFEVPEVGIIYTPLLGGYINGNNKYLTKRLKEEKEKNMHPIIKPKSKQEKMPILGEKLLALLAEKPKKWDTKDKSNKERKFDYNQMNLHLGDILEEITLKLSKDNDPKEDFNILYYNVVVEIEHSLFEFALAYTKLEESYRLEAKTLIIELLNNLSEKNSDKTEEDIELLFKEIVNQKKYFDEKREWKKRVIWVKK